MLKHSGFGAPATRPRAQAGVTLIELMIAMLISLIVAGAMVTLMANTLGTGTQTIGMTRLSQEMRAALQIMSRDLRRANYLSPIDARKCFGNVNCLGDLGYGAYIGAVKVGADTNGDGFPECFSFWADRNLNSTFDVTEAGAFRWTVTGGVGAIEMLTSYTGMDANNCPTGSWAPITEPDVIDVTNFVVDNSDTYTETIASGGATQTVQKLRLEISAELVNAGSGNITISRVFGDQIRVRNDFTAP